MPQCSFCGKEYFIPRGLTYVQTDGNIKYLCSSKCRKNRMMKRRKVRWIAKSPQGKDGTVKAFIKRKEKKKTQKKRIIKKRNSSGSGYKR
ncbi:hypothetical protein COU57_05155 [Candidatus Pacearchaeota archaeon CG10_big_fil_rev_8_21_14_0_10_32_14]|nr:MAG: hypothetical protein COU57_05155 [Candidatus Pacearchaeota archaeon CG10_big_fil_rev_8_21_14_0_10_32_14]